MCGLRYIHVQSSGYTIPSNYSETYCAPLKDLKERTRSSPRWGANPLVDVYSSFGQGVAWLVPFGLDEPMYLYVLTLLYCMYIHTTLRVYVQPRSHATWRNDLCISLGDLPIHKTVILDHPNQPKIRQFKLIVGPIFRFRAAYCMYNATWLSPCIKETNWSLISIGAMLMELTIKHGVWEQLSISVGHTWENGALGRKSKVWNAFSRAARRRENRSINISHLHTQHIVSQFRRLRTGKPCLSGLAWFFLIADQ